MEGLLSCRSLWRGVPQKGEGWEDDESVPRVSIFGIHILKLSLTGKKIFEVLARSLEASGVACGDARMLGDHLK